MPNKIGIYLAFCVLLNCLFCSFGYAKVPEIASGEEIDELSLEGDAELSADELEYLTWAKNFLASLNYQDGDIVLPNGIATLHVSENFDYLGPADARKVLEEAWGNPPGTEVLGMLVPAEGNVLSSDSWAVTLEYVEEGYVSDEDAGDIDYTDLLKDMKASARSESKERVELGYEAIELVGWAKQPYYDSASKKLYWAKEFKFGDTEVNTLNYNIRVLGRKGYLVLNFIASIDQLDEIDQAMPEVLAIAEFNQGMRYADFVPGVDTVAAYGIGALVAGKLAAKAGLFAFVLIFLKKFGIFIIAAGAGLFRMISGRSKAE